MVILTPLHEQQTPPSTSARAGAIRSSRKGREFRRRPRTHGPGPNLDARHPATHREPAAPRCDEAPVDGVWVGTGSAQSQTWVDASTGAAGWWLSALAT